jgi:hypothetical protein
MDTAVWLPSPDERESGGGTPMIDFGRNNPTRDRPPFFMPRPIFRIMMEAEDAVEETEMLSVELINILPPE